MTRLVRDVAVMPAHPRCCRICIAFLQDWACWQKSGLVRIRQKKKAHSLREGKARGPEEW